MIKPERFLLYSSLTVFEKLTLVFPQVISSQTNSYKNLPQSFLFKLSLLKKKKRLCNSAFFWFPLTFLFFSQTFSSSPKLSATQKYLSPATQEKSSPSKSQTCSLRPTTNLLLCSRFSQDVTTGFPVSTIILWSSMSQLSFLSFGDVPLSTTTMARWWSRPCMELYGSCPPLQTKCSPTPPGWPWKAPLIQIMKTVIIDKKKNYVTLGLKKMGSTRMFDKWWLNILIPT